MIFRQLDVNSDWTFGKGTSNYARDQAALALNIKTAVQSWVGDCFFDLQAGIDWKQRLGAGQQQALDQELQSLLLRIDGVTEVVSASVLFAAGTRLLTATYTVNTVYGSAFTEKIRILSGGLGG